MMEESKTNDDPEFEAAVRVMAKAIMRELDTGGTDYMQVRMKVAMLSGIPAMAIAFDEHISIIAKQLDRLRNLEDAYAAK